MHVKRADREASLVLLIMQCHLIKAYWTNMPSGYLKAKDTYSKRYISILKGYYTKGPRIKSLVTFTSPASQTGFSGYISLRTANIAIFFQMQEACLII